MSTSAEEGRDPAERRPPRARVGKMLYVGGLPLGQVAEPAPRANPPARRPILAPPDYDAIAGGAVDPSSGHVDPDRLAAELSSAWAGDYAGEWGADGYVFEFELGAITYLFDLSSGSKDLPPRPEEDRVVAAWGRSTAPAARRDESRIRGFPKPQERAEPGDTQKGHLFAHAMGGGLDVNLFPQDAFLNMGRSEEGRRFRRMERFAAAHPGTFCFAHLVYEDETWRPAALDYGVLQPDGLWHERFGN